MTLDERMEAAARGAEMIIRCTNHAAVWLDAWRRDAHLNREGK